MKTGSLHANSYGQQGRSLAISAVWQLLAAIVASFIVPVGFALSLEYEIVTRTERAELGITSARAARRRALRADLFTALGGRIRWLPSH